MRIVIDLQGAQTESRYRGIGRYSMALAQTLVRNRGQHEVLIALNGLLPDTIEPIRVAFCDLLPQKNIRVWYAPGPVRECEPGNEWRRKVAERIREAFLASLEPDVVYISSLFEGYADDAVTSIGVFALDLPTVVALHDIPTEDSKKISLSAIHYLRKKQYLQYAQRCYVLPTLKISEAAQRFSIPVDRLIESRLSISSEAEGDLDLEALHLIKHFENIAEESNHNWGEPALQLRERPRLAYVSPLPPERTGIADYSAELLPELARYYDIDVVVTQDHVSDPWINANCSLRTVDWLRANKHRVDRVLYHFGNSCFHQHMFSLLEEIPGTVVMHDFFLGHVQAYREMHQSPANAWTQELYFAHGYNALRERFLAKDADAAMWKYPVNLNVLQNAQGVVIHSDSSRRLAYDWYGESVAADLEVIPLLRAPRLEVSRSEARQFLGISDAQFVVCSFGILGPNKLNHRLLDAWLNSSLGKDPRAVLVFVGENHGGSYGVELLQAIRKSSLKNRIRITGWTDTPTFRKYLASADIAVQLRTLSRGETSAAVLDCMNYGLPTIVNANGSFAELQNDAVWMLPDEFEDAQLTEALEILWQDGVRRSTLGVRARELILNRHAPATCAAHYSKVIEYYHARSKRGSLALLKAIRELDSCPTDSEYIALAQAISQSLPVKPMRQLLVDVSAICQDDLKTGIQRVVRALTWELVHAPPNGYRVEPVFLSDTGGSWHYRYASNWTSNALGFSGGWNQDEPVEFSSDDLLLVADMTMGFVIESEHAGVFQRLRDLGVGLHFVVYDLLPIQMPEVFPPGTFGYEGWLNAVTRVADGAICISQAVANELRAWAEVSCLKRLSPLKIGWFHLGADVQSSIPTRGLPDVAEKTLARLSEVPTFLMVGTIEPRKGYLQTLAAFTQLWQDGYDINLVIVGSEGWRGLPDDTRRTIPETVERMRKHPELDRRLYWLEGISDEYLEKIYSASTCLIAASEGEGFGLPLIESAQHKLPIIARNIPAFREVAGPYAFYFEGKQANDLAGSVLMWLELYKENLHPKSEYMPWLTWKQSAQQLLDVIMNNKIDEAKLNESN